MHIRRDEIVKQTIRHASREIAQPQDVQVLHVILRRHQAQAASGIGAYLAVSTTPQESQQHPARALTDARVSRLADPGGQRAHAEDDADEDRAQRGAEDLGLPGVEADAEGGEEQGLREEVLQHEELAGRNVGRVDRAARDEVLRVASAWRSGLESTTDGGC